MEKRSAKTSAALSSGSSCIDGKEATLSKEFELLVADQIGEVVVTGITVSCIINFALLDCDRLSIRQN